MGGRSSKCQHTARRKAACFAKEERVREKACDAEDVTAPAAGDRKLACLLGARHVCLRAAVDDKYERAQRGVVGRARLLVL